MYGIAVYAADLYAAAVYAAAVYGTAMPAGLYLLSPFGVEPWVHICARARLGRHLVSMPQRATAIALAAVGGGVIVCEDAVEPALEASDDCEAWPLTISLIAPRLLTIAV